MMALKNVVIPLETEYLQAAAKARGVSKTKLVRVMLNKIIDEHLVPTIVGEGSLVDAEPPVIQYRRFKKGARK